MSITTAGGKRTYFYGDHYFRVVAAASCLRETFFNLPWNSLHSERPGSVRTAGFSGSRRRCCYTLATGFRRIGPRHPQCLAAFWVRRLMTSSLIDTHCHLDAEAFHQDLDEVILRAAAEGVSQLLTIGVTLETSQAAIVLANRHPAVSAVVGIQPNYVQSAGPSDWEQIVDLAGHPRVVGIGETGLDRYWDYAPLELQQEYFIRHINLSRQCGKPFVVHCREAEPDVVALLTQEAARGPLNGVMHSFCGDIDTAGACIDLGLHISFAGMLTFRKNQSLRDVAKTIPTDRLLVETDAPYLAPHPNRGKRNEPAWVRLTLNCLAEVHDMSPDEMAAVTTENARRLFRLR